MIRNIIKFSLKQNGIFLKSLLLVCLLTGVLVPVSVQAESGPTVLDSSVKAEFPLELGFSISAASSVDITDIRLHYVVDRETFAAVTSEVYLEFTPAGAVDAEWTWDMRKTGGLPPGTAIDYWWTVKDTSGEQIVTTKQRVRFDDTRFTWRSITEDKITLYWYRGNEGFARELMTVAVEAIARLSRDTGAYLEKSVAIYIYGSTDDLKEAMIYPQEWTGGVAYTRHGIIAIGIAPGDLDWGTRAMAHELAHLVTHQMIYNPYSDLPVWLDEGIAVYTEGALNTQFAAYLNRAIAGDSLISVRSLSSPFSAYAEQSILSYSQSYSLVEFLIRTYGQGKMLELLNTFAQGSTGDDALRSVYDFDTEGLDRLWRQYVYAGSGSAEVPGRQAALIGASIPASSGHIQPAVRLLEAVTGIRLLIPFLYL